MQTLESLEGRCPRLSNSDRQFICNIFDTGIAFSNVSAPEFRSRLRQAALDYSSIIPSLRTFLENTKYLKAMVDVIKRALPPKAKGTIRQILRKYYIKRSDSHLEIQASENDFTQESGSKEYGFWVGYRQLFLFAMRHFYGLTDFRPLGSTQSSYSHRFDRSELWTRFKNLAEKVGFTLPNLKNSRSVNSTEFDAVHALLCRLRPPELFAYDESTIAQWSNRVAAFLMDISPRTITGIPGIQSWDTAEEWSIDQRCGMTDTESFFYDQRYLFLHNIYSPDQPARENMTSFAVKRNIFKSFFPVLKLNRDSSNTPESHRVPNSSSLVDQPPEPMQIEPSTCTEPPELEESPISDEVHMDWKSSKGCKFTVQMTPSEFLGAYMPQIDSIPGVCFFNFHTQEVLFLHPSGLAELPDFMENSKSQWYAEVDLEKFTLKSLTTSDIAARCERGKSIIFHGPGGMFKSTLIPSEGIRPIPLPAFSEDESEL